MTALRTAPAFECKDGVLHISSATVEMRIRFSCNAADQLLHALQILEQIKSKREVRPFQTVRQIENFVAGENGGMRS